MPAQTNWKALLQTATRLDKSKINPWIALRNTIGVIAPLVLGFVYGQLSPGLVASLGALNVTFADGKDPYQQRARRMVMASIFCGLSVLVGAATGRDDIAATLVAAWWAFGAGMMVAISSTAGDTGVVSLVVLVVFAAQPMNPQKAALSGLLAIAGGLFQTLLSIPTWFVRPYEPERRILADLYSSLRHMIEEHVEASESPPATAQSSAASTALMLLDRDYSLEAERCRSLFNQAERARLSILAIKRLRARMRREGDESAAVLDRVLAIAAQVCDDVSRLLRREVQSIHRAKELDELQALEKMLTDDAKFQTAALAGQLRAAVLLATHSVGAGRRAFERQEARKPMALRLTSSLATLRANLALDSVAFRHALRLAICIAAGVALGRAMGLLRPYWIPMTIALVLKPDYSSTFVRGLLRLAGTYAGLLIATGLFHWLHPTTAAQIALLALITFLYRWFGPANYGILTAAVSALVVLLIALSGTSPRPVIVARALNTTMGGLLALIAYAIWPSWERRQLPEGMAAMLDAYREHLEMMIRVYVDHSGDAGRLESLRLAGRLARSNMEAAVERYRAEPGASPEDYQRTVSMLASAHRLVHALMTLEAELVANPSRPIPPEAPEFLHAVDRTLGLLVDMLRGKVHAETDYPDLRAGHTRLLESIGSDYVLLATETDRIANSLNTLGEQIRAWRLLSRPRAGKSPSAR